MKEMRYRHCFALQCAIRKVQENQVGLKLSGTHQLLLYADELNLVGVHLDNLKKKTQLPINASKEVGLEVEVTQRKLSMCGCLVTRMQDKVLA
jgi:hypothetical protein